MGLRILEHSPGRPQTPPDTATAETLHDQLRRRKMVELSAANFGLVSALLLVYAAIGSVPWAGPLGYLAVSMVGSASFWWMVRSGRNLRLPDPNMFAAQMGFAAVVLFGSFLAMPQLVGAHLCNLFVTAIFGAVQFTPKQFRLAALVGSLSTALVLWLNFDRLGLPGQHPLELALLWVYVTLSLVRFGVIAAHVGALRGRLREKNQALEASLAHITHLAEHDALTGALSRRCFVERAQRAITRCELGSGAPLCVVLLDLDHFKSINDRHGHLVGDAVLAQFAALARECLRGDDGLGRWGGEEFVLLLPGTDGRGACRLLERIHAALAEYRWSQVSPGLAVSASAGVSQWQPGDSLDALLKRADCAMYGAKANGRSRTVVAPETMAAAPAVSHGSMEGRLTPDGQAARVAACVGVPASSQ
jgi:diguanylate cyclase (GGDEF)-like protein